MKHEVLNNIDHADLLINSKFKQGYGYDFNLTSVFPVEYIRLQSHYPIFFTYVPKKFPSSSKFNIKSYIFWKSSVPVSLAILLPAFLIAFSLVATLSNSSCFLALYILLN